MKNIIRKILKESIDDFDWVEGVKKITPPEEFLYDLMSDLTISESKNSPVWVVYKNDSEEILMADNINTGTKKPILWVDYDRIWVKLRGYGLKWEEIEALCMRMLEMTHKRKVLIANVNQDDFLNVLEVTHKRKVLTALQSNRIL